MVIDSKNSTTPLHIFKKIFFILFPFQTSKKLKLTFFFFSTLFHLNFYKNSATWRISSINFIMLNQKVIHLFCNLYSQNLTEYQKISKYQDKNKKVKISHSITLKSRIILLKSTSQQLITDKLCVQTVPPNK